MRLGVADRAVVLRIEPAVSPLQASIPDACAPCGCCALRLPTQPGGPAAHIGARRAAVPWACRRSRRTPLS